MANTNFKIDNGLLVTGGDSLFQANTTVNAHVIVRQTLTVNGDMIIAGNLTYSNTSIDGSLIPTANGKALGNTTRTFDVFAGNINLSNSIVTANSVQINIKASDGIIANATGISVNASSISNGVLNIGQGGTNASSKNAALNNLLPTQSVGVAGYYLKTDGTNTSWVSGTGIQGFAGSLGYSGSVGFTGSRGDLGWAGSAGYNGSVGFTGSAGYNGSVGFTGSVGTTGFAGSVGFTGSFGVTGFTGSFGITGFTGSRGDLGWAGSAGYNGSFGVTGFTGSKGDTGFTGSRGDLGWAGSVGFTGSVSTVPGAQGFTGSASTTIGFSGSRGLTGFTGSAGPGTLNSGTTNYLPYYSAATTLSPADSATPAVLAGGEIRMEAAAVSGGRVAHRNITSGYELGGRFFIQSSTPTALNTGDFWIQI